MNTFVPALAYQFAKSPVEIEVRHEARHGGESKYSLYSLIRLNFDLMTGFSVVPLQWFSMLGMGVSAGAGLLVVVLLGRRLVIGPEEGGLFHPLRDRLLPHRAWRSSASACWANTSAASSRR